jgi:hypothetical protein
MGGLFFSIVVFFLALAKHSRITAEISSKCETINKYAKKSKMPITKESVLALMDEQGKLKNVYSRFKLAFTSPLNEETSEEELDPLQFKERLIQIQKKLREDAERYNLSVPDSLGFTKYERELSKPSEIPRLIMQLKVLEELIYIMTLSNIDSLQEINFITPTEIKKDTKPRRHHRRKHIKKRVEAEFSGDGKEILELHKGTPSSEQAIEEAGQKTYIYFDVPVTFSIICASSELIDFLYKLRVSPFIFVVDDLDVAKTEANLNKDIENRKSLEANFVVRAIVLN